MKYAFIRDHRDQFSIRAMCKMLKLHRSGFYAWLEKPLSDRSIEDQRLLKLGAWVESSVRRIVLHLPVSTPYANDWQRIARALGAAPT